MVSEIHRTLTKERRVIGEAVPEVSTKKSSVTIPPAPEETPPAHALIYSHRRNSPLGGSYAFPVPLPHAINAAEAHDPPHVILPPFSVLLSPMHSRIPPEPYVTLPFLGPERFQLSDVALGELDMKLYVSRVP